MERMMRLATQLTGFFFHTIRPSSFVARRFFLVCFLFWDHCVWKETLAMTNPDSRCLAEVEGPPGPLLLCSCCRRRPRWHDGMKGCRSRLPSSAPGAFNTPPPFIFVKFCELFLNHLSCLCAGFLRRNSTVQWANPFRVCGRQRREMWRKVL